MRDTSGCGNWWGEEEKVLWKEGKTLKCYFRGQKCRKTQRKMREFELREYFHKILMENETSQPWNPRPTKHHARLPLILLQTHCLFKKPIQIKSNKKIRNSSSQNSSHSSLFIRMLAQFHLQQKCIDFTVNLIYWKINDGWQYQNESRSKAFKLSKSSQIKQKVEKTVKIS